MPFAIEYDTIGGPEVLEYREVERETPGEGRVLVEIAARYPLAEAADAHRQSEAGGLRGKIILVP